MKKIVCCFIAALIVCCNRNPNNPYNKYNTFPIEKNLYAASIALDTVLFRFPYRVSVKENIAVIMDLHNDDHYLHAFELPEWKHIQSFGRRGEGPDEMLSCENIRFESLDSLWVCDANKMRITRWSLSEQKDSFFVREEISLNRELIRVLDFFVLEDGFFIPDYTGEGRYCKINKNGNLMDTFGKTPTIIHKNKKAKIPIAMGWRSFMDYNPTNQILAFVTQVGEVLEIYNLKDTTNTVWYGPHGEPKFLIKPDQGIPTGIMGFGNIQITEHYIYTVFEGTSLSEGYELYNQGRLPIQGGKYIYVFDHTGNPICKYNLDHYIYGMYIDEKNKLIIATDLNEEDPVLIYNLE